jgi:hypothetical protein
MKKQITFTFLTAALALCTLPLVAQDTSATAQGSATASTPSPQTIKDRAENQQDRIAQGVKSGELTTGEAANLEEKESTLNKETSNMRQADDGHLTAADKAKITQQQNQLSKDIYKDKHNAATQNPDPKSEIGQRQENQQDRIAQGIQSGKIGANEAAHLEKNESQISNEVSKDRAANGGKLTAAEHAQVNHQLNQESRQITRAAHGGGRR